MLAGEWVLLKINDHKTDLFFAAESGTQECKCYVSLRTIGHLRGPYGKIKIFKTKLNVIERSYN